MTLPIDRTWLTQAALNQVPEEEADPEVNYKTLKTSYDTIDELNLKTNNHASATVLAHPDGSVTREKLANGAVNAQKLADGAVTLNKIPDGILTANKFVPGALTNDTQNALRITALQAETVTGLINAVTSFGADSTGASDSTAAIKKAIQAAIENSRALYLQTGTYKVSEPLLVTDALQVIGDGAKFVLTASMAALFDASSKIILDGLDIDADNKISEALVKHTNDFPIIRNCIFRNMTKVTLNPAGSVSSSDVYGIIENNRHYNVANGYFMYGSNNGMVAKGTVYMMNNYFDSACGGAYYFGYLDQTFIQNNVFNADPALTPQVNNDRVFHVFDEGNLYRNYARGSTVGYLSRKVRIAGNTYEGITGYATSLDTRFDQLDVSDIATYPFSVIANFDASAGTEPVTSADKNQAVRVIKGGTINGRKLKVDDLLIYNPDQPYGYDWYPDVENSDSIISNNIYKDCSDMTIYIQASDVLITGNIFDNSVGANRDMIRVNESVRVRVTNNEIYHAVNTATFVRATTGSIVDVASNKCYFDNYDGTNAISMLVNNDSYSKIRQEQGNILYITSPTSSSFWVLNAMISKVIVDTSNSFFIRLPAESGTSDLYYEVEIIRVDSNQSAEITLSTVGGNGSINGGSTTVVYCNQIMKVVRAGSASKYKTYTYDQQTIKRGTTANRPTNSAVRIGYEYFDTTLGKPVWNKGSVWVDATGTTV